MDLEDYNVVQQGCISCKLTLMTHYLKIENDIKLNVLIYNFLNLDFRYAFVLVLCANVTNTFSMDK